MSETTTSVLNRLRILYLLKMLREKTDEQHHLTMSDILDELDRYGIKAGRKAIYEDLEALTQYGADIIAIKGKYSGYYLASREFELPELKLLADAVTSSKFLTQKKSNELLKKLGSLAGSYESTQLQREVHVKQRAKSENEMVYINVDTIHRAIAERKKIRFKYFDYNMQKKKSYRSGERICSPYALVWDNSNYYLVGYYEKRNHNTNFRVDKMEKIEILPDSRIEPDDSFSIKNYLDATFSMFSGEPEEVKMRFHKSLVNTVIDRFGRDVHLIPEDEEHFTVRRDIIVEAAFLSWIFQFGDKAEILSPDSVKERYREMLRNALERSGG